jgi:exodeoxyribonuclease V
MSITLTSEQTLACSTINEWFQSGHARQFTLGGLAGTGKTTLLQHLPLILPNARIAFGAYTGKAVSVLASKGIPDPGTLHSLLYNAEKKKNGSFFFRPKPLDCDLLVVDEASMVSKDLYAEISGRRCKTLYVGDHGQLPPVGDNPNLMARLDFRLETILRQALDSPIIRFAHSLRNGESPVYQQEDRLLVGPRSSLSWSPDHQILCAYNKTRVSVNQAIRRQLGYTSLLPVPGDKIICLKNSREWGLFNGLLCTVLTAETHGQFVHLVVKDEMNATYGPLPCPISQFNNASKLDDDAFPYNPDYPLSSICLFDYAYAITTHKAQGSEWPNVIVIEERSTLWPMPTWRYTAATRARDTLQYLL